MTVRRLLVLLPAVLAFFVISLPAASAQEAVFTDVEGTGFEDAVTALVSIDLVQGCGDGEFCADRPLTRAHVATILAGALELPPADLDATGVFPDARDSAHRETIDAVAAAGFMLGCGDALFCPDEPISRAQLATTLKRAFDVPDPAEDRAFFADVDGAHAPAIRSIAAAGISNGCDLVNFCPEERLQRGQAAMFFARSLELVDRTELAPFDERQAQYEEQLAAEKEAAAEAEAKAEAAATAPADKAVEVALAQLGKPYRWAGSGPNSFDCSGLTSYAWAAAGVNLPHSSRMQYSATTRISRSELRPGDLVFYHSPISHVAMYIGDGRVVESPNSGNNVRIREDGLTRSGVVGYGRP